MSVAAAGLYLSGVCAASGQTSSGSYSPAFLETGGGAEGPVWLTVFAPGSEAVAVPLPFPMRSHLYSTMGTSLYAQPMPLGACLYKIEFNPMRTTSVACPPALQFQSLAVSKAEDRMLFSGRYGDTGNPSCGVFEMSLPSGSIRQVFKDYCGVHMPWQSLSYSPDGKQAVAIFTNSLGVNPPFSPFSIVVITLDSGKGVSLGAKFDKVSWSPDGRWIAALERRERARTILFDAKTFRRARALPDSWVEWSPDSRYLLRVNECRGEEGTVEALDINKGSRMPIKSSRCKVYNISTGWVDNSVLPPRVEGRAATGIPLSEH